MGVDVAEFADLGLTVGDLEAGAREAVAFFMRSCLRDDFVPDLLQPWPLNLRLRFLFGLLGREGGMAALEVVEWQWMSHRRTRRGMQQCCQEEERSARHNC